MTQRSKRGNANQEKFYADKKDYTYTGERRVEPLTCVVFLYHLVKYFRLRFPVMWKINNTQINLVFPVQGQFKFVKYKLLQQVVGHNVGGIQKKTPVIFYKLPLTDPYFVRYVGHQKLCYRKYCDSQTINLM